LDYKETLNLPRTKFPMKANLTKKEKEILKTWEEMDIYNYVLKTREDHPLFILHDGPPYANGHIHLGTAMNKILKDIVMKYKTMRGYKVPYIPGWDTHGLPIEHRVSQELGEKVKDMTPSQIRDECEKFARRFVEIQKEEFKRLGVRGDWKDPYLTLSPDYETKILKIFNSLVKSGNVYRARKPIYWCPHCRTALAEAEIEYYDHTSPSIYVKFHMKDEENSYILIWTTTPWTLPANVGIAVHPEYDYVQVSVNGEKWILAKDLLENSMKELGIKDYKVLKIFSGKELEGKKAIHPLYDRESLVILADYVAMDAGTGCVHIAPGHGEEDYIYGHLKYNLPVLSPVDDEGIFTEEAGKYAGMFIEDANEEIIKDLEEKGALLKYSKVTHSYPHCWRCKNPVMFRAVKQWFISMDENDLRDKVLKEIENVKWIPAWGKNRIKSMVEERPDWCISRQRVWGTPIPAFVCENCGEEILDPKIVERFIEIVEKEGTNAWFKMSEKELLLEGYRCPKCGSTNLKKMMDTLDVWIDSGSSFEYVLSKKDHRFPADMYLEGSDQHRGWFQSSIFLSVAYRGKAPYREVLTHGFIKDELGRKMSKSLGNVIDPMEVVEKFGADVLRLWLSSSDYFDDIRISMRIVEQQAEVYRKIRNTIRFILGNLHDFDPVESRVDFEDLLPIDKWALSRLQRIIKEVTEAYDRYEFSRVYNMMNRYCSVELSSIYLDIIKDRLYVEAKDSIYRRSAQTVLHEILISLTKMLAPILTFTMEEVYQYFHEKDRKYKTIQAETWPEYREDLVDEETLNLFDALLRVREDVLKALEEERQRGLIGHSLDAKVSIKPKNEGIKKVLESSSSFLEEFFIVSQVEISNDIEGIEGEEVVVNVERAKGKKCQRCWKYHPDVGKDPEYPDVCPRCSAVLRGERR